MARLWLGGGLVGLVLCAALLISLWPHLQASSELVRIRNALLLDATPAQPDWTPANPPAGFKVERAPPTAMYAGAVQRHRLQVPGDDWASALAIGRHLLSGPRLAGPPIQSGLDESYRRIVSEGHGYCGDFADVFTGLANAAGVFSRPWAFSFDGFGGHGHILNEIWDRGLQRWIAIDVFHNVFFQDPQGRALSALELKSALVEGAPLTLARIRPGVFTGYDDDARLLAYYRRGAGEWYRWRGNNVFERDQAPLVRWAAHLGRAPEQLAGIVSGVYPSIRLLHEDNNAAARSEMLRLRTMLLSLVVLGPLSLMCLFLAWTSSQRARP